jgi:hypothetical protein
MIIVTPSLVENVLQDTQLSLGNNDVQQRITQATKLGSRDEKLNKLTEDLWQKRNEKKAKMAKTEEIL